MCHRKYNRGTGIKARILFAWTVAVVLTLLWLACTPGFDEEWEVKDTRILAVKVEPPELVCTNPTVPHCDDVTVEVSVLIARGGNSNDSFSFQARLCPIDAQYQCIPTPTAAPTIFGEAEFEEFRFELDVPAQLIEEARPYDPAQGMLGVALFVKGSVELENSSLGFLKSVLFTPGFPPSKKPNSNPKITAITYRRDDSEAGDFVSLPTDVTFSASIQETYRFLPQVEDSSREEFQIITFDGQIRTETEKITYYYYAECGSLSRWTATERPNILFETEQQAKQKDLSVIWTPPQRPAECQLYFVVDDGRGGVDWKILRLTTKHER